MARYETAVIIAHARRPVNRSGDLLCQPRSTRRGTLQLRSCRPSMDECRVSQRLPIFLHFESCPHAKESASRYLPSALPPRCCRCHFLPGINGLPTSYSSCRTTSAPTRLPHWATQSSALRISMNWLDEAAPLSGRCVLTRFARRAARRSSADVWRSVTESRVSAENSILDSSCSPRRCVELVMPLGTVASGTTTDDLKTTATTPPRDSSPPEAASTGNRPSTTVVIRSRDTKVGSFATPTASRCPNWEWG